MTFDQWMNEVDTVIAGLCGLGHNDLADWHYWDAWNDGASAEEAAYNVLEEEGFPFE